MSVWSWVFEYSRQAEASGDPDALEILRLQEQSARGKDDPPAALAACDQGAALAKRLGLPWWEVYFHHWKLQTLMNVLQDYRQAPELAVKATLRATRPDCSSCPQRICVHEDLISIYLDSDPVGHAENIEQALGYMERELTDDLECRHCFLADRATFSLALGDVDSAESSARKLLAVLSGLPYRSAAHHEMTAFGKLCEIAYVREDWAAMSQSAEEGELRKLHCRRPAQVAEFLAWQALAQRMLGKGDRAAKLLTRAKRQRETTSVNPGTYYFEPIRAYHERAEEHDEALAVTDEELSMITGKGMTERECRCLIARCRLRAALGLPTGADVEAARKALGGLRKPQALQETLDHIARGNSRGLS